MKKPEALIFDMDGTLWDATDTYVKAWNLGLQRLGIGVQVDRPLLDSMMGWERSKAFKKVFPMARIEDHQLIYDTINAAQADILPTEGGRM